MQNSFEDRGDHAAIYINSQRHGKIEALIDSADLPRVRAINGTWGVSRTRESAGLYVAYQKWNPRVSILLHRFIIDAPPNAHVDHINHDTLDNRRSNLRLASRTLNALNRAVGCGASFHPVWRKWYSTIIYKGRKIHLGEYDSKDSAILVHAGAVAVLDAIESNGFMP